MAKSTHGNTRRSKVLSALLKGPKTEAQLCTITQYSPKEIRTTTQSLHIDRQIKLTPLKKWVLSHRYYNSKS